MTNPHNTPAFPTSARGFSKEGGSIVDSKEGMSMLDWYAGQALAGMLANGWACSATEYAMGAYNFADAMMAERAKRRGEKP